MERRNRLHASWAQARRCHWGCHRRRAVRHRLQAGPGDTPSRCRRRRPTHRRAGWRGRCNTLRAQLARRPQLSRRAIAASPDGVTCARMLPRQGTTDVAGGSLVPPPWSLQATVTHATSSTQDKTLDAQAWAVAARGAHFLSSSCPCPHCPLCRLSRLPPANAKSFITVSTRHPAVLGSDSPQM